MSEDFELKKSGPETVRKRVLTTFKSMRKASTPSKPDTWRASLAVTLPAPEQSPCKAYLTSWSVEVFNHSILCIQLDRKVRLDVNV